MDSPDLSPSCKACTSKGVAEPLYLALIASRRFRRCSIRAASSRGSSSGASLADGLEVLQNVSDDLRLRIGMLTFVTQNYYLFGDYASAKILA